MSIDSTPTGRTRGRAGVALVGVLYFLVVCALASVALISAQRAATKNIASTRDGARLLAAADAGVYFALANWDPLVRGKQGVGSSSVAESTTGGVTTTTTITRITTRLFSIVAEARLASGDVARRVSLMVRVPIEAPRLHAALVSAVGVAVGPNVRFVADSSSCGDTTATTLILASGAPLVLDAGIPPGAEPSVRRDSAAADSMTYLRIGNAWWNDLARRADIRLARDSRVTPAPMVAGADCVPSDANWGDPSAPTSACGDRLPLVYVPGDLVIDGGAGQGVLLVDGHLTIAGPFTYSGQIVARHGIETLADNITISGVVYAWRASSDTAGSHASSGDVVLTHATTIRRSSCDAEHGVASWQQPRRVRERAWTELF